MTTFVLVHGAGHGGWCYQRVARLLEAAGETVYTPTLTGLGERSHLISSEVDLETHITDVVNLLHYEDVRDAVLVGHSYGAFVATGAADRASERIAKLVHLDAPPVDAPPKNGQTVVDAYPPLRDIRQLGRVVDGVELILFLSEDPEGFAQGTGVTDPADIEWMKARLTPHPWRSIEQPLVLRNEAALEALPQYHIATSGTLPARDEAFVAAKRAEGRFWVVDTGHDLMITEPQIVADLLTEIAGAASVAAPRRVG